MDIIHDKLVEAMETAEAAGDMATVGIISSLLGARLTGAQESLFAHITPLVKEVLLPMAQQGQADAEAKLN